MPFPGETAHADTVYLTVVDADRNAVSFINSIFHSFGSGLLDAASGVLFNNRGAGFVIDPKHPNCIAPKKRPMHTIIPGMMRKDDRPIMTFGVMGGHYQPVGHAHFVTNLLDFEMDIQEALDAPRTFAYGNQLQVERGVSRNVVEGLQKLGHETVEAELAIGTDVGFRMNPMTGEYELVADIQTWKDPVPPKRFVEKVTQQYARMTVHNQIKEMGFKVEEEWEMDDNSIELVVTRWV